MAPRGSNRNKRCHLSRCMNVRIHVCIRIPCRQQRHQRVYTTHIEGTIAILSLLYRVSRTSCMPLGRTAIVAFALLRSLIKTTATKYAINFRLSVQSHNIFRTAFKPRKETRITRHKVVRNYVNGRGSA